MEHIRKDCKVKKEAKQVAEMRSQNAKLREKLQNLTKELAKKNETIKELEKKVSNRNTNIQCISLFAGSSQH